MPVVGSSQGRQRDATRHYPNPPKELIPNGPVPQEKKKSEPPTFAERLLCAWPVLSITTSHWIPSAATPRGRGEQVSIFQVRALRPRVCKIERLAQGTGKDLAGPWAG